MTLYCSFCGERLEKQVWRCPYCGSILKMHPDVSGMESENIPVNIPVKRSENDRIIMTNGWKALLAAVFAFIPGIGQIMGIITSIYYMNSQNEDIRSYGSALFKICLVIFPISVAFFTLSGILIKAVYYMK